MSNSMTKILPQNTQRLKQWQRKNEKVKVKWNSQIYKENFYVVKQQISIYPSGHTDVLRVMCGLILPPNNTYIVKHIETEQNGRHFADDVFKCIFLNENVWILLKISLKFVPKGPINNIPSLVQIMAWRQPGDKSLSEPMMVSLLTHICVARPQWVKILLTVRTIW